MELARQWLEARGRSKDVPLVTAMIDEHHKVFAYEGDPLVELFRQADWIDATQAARIFSLPRAEVRALRQVRPK